MLFPRLGLLLKQQDQLIRVQDADAIQDRSRYPDPVQSIQNFLLWCLRKPTNLYFQKLRLISGLACGLL